MKGLDITHLSIVAARFVDEFAPGQAVPAGRYDEATLRRLLDKGHFAAVAATPAEVQTTPAKPAAKKQD